MAILIIILARVVGYSLRLRRSIAIRLLSLARIIKDVLAIFVFSNNFIK